MTVIAKGMMLWDGTVGCLRSVEITLEDETPGGDGRRINQSVVGYCVRSKRSSAGIALGCCRPDQTKNDHRAHMPEKEIAGEDRWKIRDDVSDTMINIVGQIKLIT